MNRTYDERSDPGRYHAKRPGIYAVILARGGLLLTVQSDPKPEYQLPGGGVEANEHPIPALHREVLEETGFTISAPRRIGMFHRYVYMPDYDRHAHKQCSVYLAQAGRRIGPPSEAGHVAIILPWAEAVQRLAVEGDRVLATRIAQLLGVWPK